MKKILHLNEYGSLVGGAESYIENISGCLRREGFKNFLFYDHKGTESSFTQLDGTAQFVYGKEDDTAGRQDTKKLRQIEELRPDLVYLHNYYDNGLLEKLVGTYATIKYFHDFRLTCPSGRTRGKAYINCTKKLDILCQPVALRYRCMPRNPVGAFLLIREFRRNLEAHNQCATSFVASHFMKDLLALNGLRKDRLHINPYFTTINNGAEKATTGSYFLFIGRIVAKKGLSYLIRAVAKSEADLKLLVIGDGPERGHLEKLVHDIGISGRVDFLGWKDRSEISHELAGARALIIPSIWPEPFGIVGLEAMACKTPVIAFDAGGISEWLHDEVNGLLVRSKDIQGLSTCMDRLMADANLSLEMGSRGYDMLEERFSQGTHLGILLRHLNKSNFTAVR